MNYGKCYNLIIEKAVNRNLVGYKEKHHIIPKCLGGTDVNDNLVFLTAREHFICHVLLAKIHNSHGLWAAVQMMSSRKLINSRLYEHLKINFSKKHSEFMTGKNFSTPESIKKFKETKTKNGTFKLSEETKRKISEATKGRVIETTPEKRIKCSEGSKGRKWVNNGTDSCMAKGEKLDLLLTQGWVYGRLMTDTLTEGIKKGAFKKGSEPHNKGIPMSPEQKEKVSSTFFKKGHTPHNKKQ